MIGWNLIENKEQFGIFMKHDCHDEYIDVDEHPKRYPCYVIQSQYNDQSVRIDWLDIIRLQNMIKKIKN